MVTITFCFKTSTLGRKPFSLVDANNDFLLQLQGLSERKAGFLAVFRRFFSYVFPGILLGWFSDVTKWRSTKKHVMKMHALLDEEKRTCSMRHWSYDVTTERKSLWSKSPPEIENCSFCFEIKPTHFDNNFETQNRHVTQATKQTTKRLKTNFVWGIGPSWGGEICWFLVHRCFSFQTMSRAKQPRSIQKIEGNMWLDSGEVLVIQQQLVPRYI